MSNHRIALFLESVERLSSMKSMLDHRVAAATLSFSLGWISACGNAGETVSGVEAETMSSTGAEPTLPAAGPNIMTDHEPSATGPGTTGPSTTSTAPGPLPDGAGGSAGDASEGQGAAASAGGPTSAFAGGMGGSAFSGAGGADTTNTGGAAMGGAPPGSAGAGGGATAGDGGVGTGGGGTGVGGTGSSGCQEGKVVHFVYFVEADQEYSESQHADIEQQAFTFQEYWYQQLGVTFYLNEPVVDVIEADEDSRWYVETPDGIHADERWYRLGNVKNEVYSKLGIQDFDDDHRVVNYPITRHDGRVGGNFGGAWMDGDDLDCMSGGALSYPYDDGNAAHCLGHPVHEFGHVLGLDHTGPDDDCMQFGFYLGGGEPEMCDFSEENVQSILSDADNDGWFEALPGETCKGR